MNIEINIDSKPGWFEGNINENIPKNNLLDGLKNFIQKLFNLQSKPFNGKVLTQDFNWGNVHTKERVVRIDIGGNLANEIRDLKNTIDATTDPVQKKQLQVKLAHLRDVVKTGWITSNYFRDLIADHGFTKACDLFVAQPVNMRYQELVVDGERKQAFARLGVITAPDGFNNIDELIVLQNNPDKRKEKLDGLKTYIGKCKSSDQFEAVDRAIGAITPPLPKGQKAANLSEEAIQLHIGKAIEERKAILTSQFVELLKLQLQENRPKAGATTFSLLHLSLLNPMKKVFEKCGWFHDEENAMKDMNWIFQYYDGKTICFDAKEGDPFEGADGKLHLPPTFQGNGPKEIKLDATFFNLSVQGYTKNDGSQKTINEKNYQKIKGKLSPDERTELEKILFKKTKSSYDSAGKFASTIMNSNKFIFSLNCLSAKDRTGLVAGMVNQYKIRELIDERISSPITRWFAKRSFANAILDPEGVAPGVVNDCGLNSKKKKGQTRLKIGPIAMFSTPISFDKGIRYNFGSGICKVLGIF